MPLVALCQRHFLADSIIYMCVFDFRQSQPFAEAVMCLTGGRGADVVMTLSARTHSELPFAP